LRGRGWAADIAETQGTAPNYPIIADHDFNVAKVYGMHRPGRRRRRHRRLSGTRPYRFTGGTINRVAIDVSGEPNLDLEREAAAMLARE